MSFKNLSVCLKNHKKFVLVIIIIFPIVVRLNTLTKPLNDRHVWRQSEIYAIAYHYAFEDRNLLNPATYRIHPPENTQGLYLYEFPVYEYILSLIIRLLGDSLIYLRLFSLILSIVITVCLYVLGNKIIRPPFGFVSATIYNVFPSSIFWGRSLSHDLFATSMYILSFTLLISRKKTYINTLIAFLLLGLAIATKPPYCLFLFPICFMPGVKRLLSKIPLYKLAFLLSTLFLPIGIWLIRRALVPLNIREPNSFLWFFSANENIFEYIRSTNFFEFLIKERVMGEVLTPLGGFLFLTTLIILFLQKNKSIFLLSWATSSVVAIISLPWGNYNHDYYQIQILPIASLSITYLVSVIISHFKKTNYKTSSILFISFAFTTYYLWFVPLKASLLNYYHPEVNYNDFISDINYIQRIVSEDKFIAIYQYPDIDEDPVLFNLLKRKGYILFINDECKISNFNKMLETYPYTKIQYILVPKERFRYVVLPSDCGGKGMVDWTLNQNVFKFQQIFTGNKITLLKKII
jgi:4-amino-4-deoxy-L-arabinose transferase-like glycosyltransferase